VKFKRVRAWCERWIGWKAMDLSGAFSKSRIALCSADVAGMVKVFAAEALGELEDLAAELTELETDPGKIRPSTWRKRLSAYTDQRAKVELYASLLETEALHFTKRLNELEVRVHQHLVG
jgi:hypothetical protein